MIINVKGLSVRYGLRRIFLPLARGIRGGNYTLEGSRTLGSL